MQRGNMEALEVKHREAPINDKEEMWYAMSVITEKGLATWPLKTTVT